MRSDADMPTGRGPPPTSETGGRRTLAAPSCRTTMSSLGCRTSIAAAVRRSRPRRNTGQPAETVASSRATLIGRISASSPSRRRQPVDTAWRSTSTLWIPRSADAWRRCAAPLCADTGSVAVCAGSSRCRTCRTTRDVASSSCPCQADRPTAPPDRDTHAAQAPFTLHTTALTMRKTLQQNAVAYT